MYYRSVVSYSEKLLQADGPLGIIRRLRRFVGRILRWSVGPKMFIYEQYPPRPLRLPSVNQLPKDGYQWPSFAIVTPSLGQGRFVASTINSILDQDYPRVSYTVQDGGSTDETLRILESYGAKLSWRSAPDRGQAHAINLGFERVSGDIMGWLNSDDMLTPGTLSYVAAAFAKHPEIDFFYGNRIYIDGIDREIGRCILPQHHDETLRWMDFVPQETMFWRRRAWDKIGPLNESFLFALDWDFLLRARANGLRMHRLPRFLGCFRVHDDQKNYRLRETGNAEMTQLRTREFGAPPSLNEIRKGVLGYTLRHGCLDRAYRAGLYRI